MRNRHTIINPAEHNSLILKEKQECLEQYCYHMHSHNRTYAKKQIIKMTGQEEKLFYFTAAKLSN